MSSRGRAGKESESGREGGRERELHEAGTALVEKRIERKSDFRKQTARSGPSSRRNPSFAFCEHLKLDGDGLPILLLLPNFITAQTPLIPITIPA